MDRNDRRPLPLYFVILIALIASLGAMATSLTGCLEQLNEPDQVLARLEPPPPARAVLAPPEPAPPIIGQPLPPPPACVGEDCEAPMPPPPPSCEPSEATELGCLHACQIEQPAPGGQRCEGMTIDECMADCTAGTLEYGGWCP